MLVKSAIKPIFKEVIYTDETGKIISTLIF